MYIASGCTHKDESTTQAVDVTVGRVYVCELIDRGLTGHSVDGLLRKFYAKTKIEHACIREGQIHQIWTAKDKAQETLTFLETNARRDVIVAFLGWPNHPTGVQSLASAGQ